MTDKILTKPVREARAKARLMARGGAATYRQALDIVAREAGCAHWNAFVTKHADDGVTETAANEKPRFDPIPEHVRKGNGPIAITRDMATVQEYDLHASTIMTHALSGATHLVITLGGMMIMIMIAGAPGGNDAEKPYLIGAAVIGGLCCASPGFALLIRSLNATRILIKRRLLART